MYVEYRKIYNAMDIFPLLFVLEGISENIDLMNRAILETNRLQGTSLRLSF
jgi:hypothetical protein